MRAGSVAALLTLLATAVSAQTRPLDISRADSGQILRSAKSAQIHFESRRRFLAPSFNAGSKGTCQTIGRFCRRASGVPFALIPEEPGGTTRARAELLAILKTAAAKIPGDGWIAGQRIRYLIEQGEDSSAREAAASCAAERWWCDALAGLVEHSSSRFVAAEQSFARALREMPEAKRCEWSNLSELLDGDALRAYEKLGCGEREVANRRIWWLADPLFSTPGNERRTEHFARHVWAEIDRGGTNGFGMSWAPDMKEMIVRFGWAEKWTQRPPSGFSDGSQAYVAHEREPDFHFLPSIRFDAPLPAFSDTAWKLEEENPHEGYSPRYAAAFLSIEPQIARFSRGDSTLLVAAFDVAADTTWKYVAVRPALIVAADDTTRFLIARFDSTPRRSALWLTAPSREALVGVELMSLDGKIEGRWRAAFQPLAADTARRGISDLLLFDATDSLASAIEGAIESANGNNLIRQNRKLGVYWETYGEGASDSAQTVSLMLTPLAPGVVTRVLRALGVGKRLSPVDVRWRSAGLGATIQPRSVLLDLSQVTPGRYDLRLTVGEGSGASTTSKPVVIER